MNIQAQMNEESMAKLFSIHTDLKDFLSKQDEHHYNQLRYSLLNNMCALRLLDDCVVVAGNAKETWLREMDYVFKYSHGYISQSEF